MKRLLTGALISVVTLLGPPLIAADNYQLETNVYVFKNSDFRAVKLPGSNTDQTKSVVFNSPAVAQFDQETLSLEGAQFVWSGGRNPPEHFTLTGAPTLPLGPGKPVSLLSATPIQYLEKSGDGTLQVREIGSDSPDAPHFQLTFTRSPTAEDTRDAIPLTCELDIATVAKREKISGLTLEVGKPVLRQFKERLALAIPADAWSALALQAPNGSDYSLLVLLKAGRENATAAGIEAAEAAQLATLQDLDTFATYYYRNPRPDLVPTLIESLPKAFSSDHGESERRFWMLVGFFAEVFAANPERMDEWQKLANSRWNWTTKECLRAARELSRPGAVLALEDWYKRRGTIFSRGHDGVYTGPILWGAFFASGNPAYVQKFVAQLRRIDPAHGGDWRGNDAMWNLAVHAPKHPLIRRTLEEARTSEDPRTRQLIDDVLSKDLESLRQELQAMAPNFERLPSPRMTGNIFGERDHATFESTPSYERSPRP